MLISVFFSSWMIDMIDELLQGERCQNESKYFLQLINMS